jgi:hypothetical protein
MSADGGSNWEAVTPGNKHYFTNIGNDLRWQAELRGSLHRSSYLYGVNITYTYNETTPTTTPPTTTPTNTSTSPISLIGGFVGVTLVVSSTLVIFTLVRRRKKN